ncbi:hypothetical protein JOE37_002052 [Clavibacter michiganensis]|nr:hypothetical protein [Clavibacter michiganensis]
MSAVRDIAALDALAPISLEELVARAALLTRVDRKYVVPLAQLDDALAGLEPGTRALEIDGRRAAAYRSVYFDTPELTSFHLAVRGRRRRFKVRTRSYLDTGECALEVKTRGGRSSTVKDRVAYVAGDERALTPTGLAHVDETLHDAGIHDVAPRRLRPTLVTEYDRATLFVPGDESRATVDTALTWILDDRRLELPGVAIVETKSGSRPSAVDRLLWSRGHRPATISKYGTGLAALRDDLPGNRWNRVIRRHFLDGALSAA